MKTYGVTLPVCGKVYVEVEAEDEDAAIEAALALRIACQGNIFHGCCNEAYAELVDDGE